MEYAQSVALLPQVRETAENFLNELLQRYGLERKCRNNYKPAVLIQDTFKHVQAKDKFLKLFLFHIYGAISGEKLDVITSGISPAVLFFRDFPLWDDMRKRDVVDLVENFAEFLMDSFFIPLRASTLKTPQPTPAEISSMQPSSTADISERVSKLRKECLIRDHHRCCISLTFDYNEAKKRSEEDGENCRDDDGNLLRELHARGSLDLEELEVAHIVPHYLYSVSESESESVIDESKKTVLNILGMFEPLAAMLVKGHKIDSPLNALTLAHKYHRRFGEFEIYFEATEQPHRYKIDSTEHPILKFKLLPVFRTLQLCPKRTMDPPHPKLLAFHRAICLILKQSDAGKYLFRIWRDMDDSVVEKDGSTCLAELVRLRLGGWPITPAS